MTGMCAGGFSGIVAFGSDEEGMMMTDKWEDGRSVVEKPDVGG